MAALNKKKYIAFGAPEVKLSTRVRSAGLAPIDLVHSRRARPAADRSLENRGAGSVRCCARQDARGGCARIQRPESPRAAQPNMAEPACRRPPNGGRGFRGSAALGLGGRDQATQRRRNRRLHQVGHRWRMAFIGGLCAEARRYIRIRGRRQVRFLQAPPGAIQTAAGKSAIIRKNHGRANPLSQRRVFILASRGSACMKASRYSEPTCQRLE